MTFVALSNDESNHKNSTNVGQCHYAIVQEEWRLEELIRWLWMINLFACREKWDRCNVARPGNCKRLCIVSTHSKSGEAVHELLENCYNPSWLGALKCYEREDLKVRPAIDMTFTEDEQVCTFWFCHFVLVKNT